MMPKFGNSTRPSYDILEEIEYTGKLGFDYVEITIEGPKAFAEDLRRRKEKILKLLRKYRMFAVGHSMWFVDFGIPYESVRKGWVEEGKKDIDVARELGIKLLVFHLESTNPLLLKDSRMKRKILGNNVKSMKELVEYGGKKGVSIVLENGIRKELSELSDYKYVIDRVRGLGVHIDIGHAFMLGGMKNVMKFIRTFRKKIEHIHMHDNRGKKDEHLPLGLGELDYEKVAKALKKIGYNTTITFEVFAKEQDLAAFSVEKFKRAFKT
ncbi:MAG: sugar phosphate isomerase/epimerase [Candidatus Aenigmatarchaeota archaeon]|nr:MAG: sugar phosphate isomerase/epimerase [Candidatus Aenigmarchaeota archaeon]